MTPNPVDKPESRVIPFRPRTTSRAHAFGNLAADRSPVRDLAKYGHPADDDDDYAHRMKMNALAVLVLAVLIAGGMWIVDTMARTRKMQDCVLSGQRDCAHLNDLSRR